MHNQLEPPNDICHIPPEQRSDIVVSDPAPRRRWRNRFVRKHAVVLSVVIVVTLSLTSFAIFVHKPASVPKLPSPVANSSDPALGTSGITVTKPSQSTGKSKNTTGQSSGHGSSTSSSTGGTGTASGTGSAVIILVHGGGWVSGDKADMRKPAEAFSAAGYVVLNINYPLATDTSPGYPVQEETVMKTVDWAIANKNSLGIDPTRIGLFGGSAGGELVLQAGQRSNKQPGHKVKAVMAMSPGATDFWATILWLRSGNTSAYQKYADLASGAEKVFGCSIDTCSESLAKAASPIYNITSNCPVTSLIHAQSEVVPLYVSQTYDQALRNAGCSSELKVVNGSKHGLGNWDATQPYILDWFKRSL